MMNFSNVKNNIAADNAPSTPLEVRKFGVHPGSSEPMSHNLFIPDYTVRAVTDVTYLRIPKSIYSAAKQATLLERSYSHADSNAMSKAGDNFEYEYTMSIYLTIFLHITIHDFGFFIDISVSKLHR